MSGQEMRICRTCGTNLAPHDEFCSVCAFQGALQPDDTATELADAVVSERRFGHYEILIHAKVIHNISLSYSSLRMTFTTPAMASVPYVALPPSFRISMRSTAAMGIEFKSTKLIIAAVLVWGKGIEDTGVHRLRRGYRSEGVLLNQSTLNPEKS
jgi:hypothetical protein